MDYREDADIDSVARMASLKVVPDAQVSTASPHQDFCMNKSSRGNTAFHRQCVQAAM